jgi:ABC-type methionine transport system permease subunit
VADPVSLSDMQLQKILAAIEGLKQSNGVHWETVIPVFISSLLAMLVGILLEIFRRWLERRKLEANKAKDELTQINVATVGISRSAASAD